MKLASLLLLLKSAQLQLRRSLEPVSAPGNGSTPLGAYGFRLVLVEPEADLPDLVPVSGAEPLVPIVCRFAAAVEDVTEVQDGLVALMSRKGLGTRVHREPRSIEIYSPVPTSAEALVHPLLTVPLAVLARWRGDVTLHGGAFVHAGAAWAILGERTAGKSSMLAVLGARGIPIAADDLLVIDDGWVRSGPSCVDLRPDMAAQLPQARDLGYVGTRPRARLATPPAPARIPLGGVFLMEWHDEPEPELLEMPTMERLQLIYGQESVGILGKVAPDKVMRLLEVPFWRFRRRRSWEDTPRAVERLLEVAAAEAQA
jgi:hypothetical protein